MGEVATNSQSSQELAYNSGDKTTAVDINDSLDTGPTSSDITQFLIDEAHSPRQEERAEYGADYQDAQRVLEAQHLTIQEVLKAGVEALRAQNSFQSQALTLSESTSSWIGNLDKDRSPGRSQRLLERCNSCHSIKMLRDGTPYIAADPYRNHIRLENINLLSACLANASMLGLEISITARTKIHPHSPQISPIYQTKLLMGDSAAVEEHYSTVSRDLQPCKEQIEREHDIYVDLLPFPDFRKRIMAARAVQPPLFNEQELCEDLDNGAFVIWGSRGTGTPWDMRSWEAKPWFLKKWWMLTGGVGGEMHRQSKVSCRMSIAIIS